MNKKLALTGLVLAAACLLQPATADARVVAAGPRGVVAAGPRGAVVAGPRGAVVARGVPVRAVYAPVPVYAPAPVYMAPAPVYVAPAPVYVAPVGGVIVTPRAVVRY